MTPQEVSPPPSPPPHSMRSDFLDASQYFSWMTCPWKWAERYINRVQKSFPAGAQRDDNLAVGSLVHAGLETWYNTGVPEIPQQIISELGPTPDALDLCKALVWGFARQYPVELWTLQMCEEPLRRPLVPAEPEQLLSPASQPISLLAKIDSYFLTESQISINSGVTGEDLSLAPGYWIQEFKTKAAGIDRGKWMKTWVVNMQASFQILCLRHKLEGLEFPVQGVLVSVLEKPKPYIPKRKCQGCGETNPLGMWRELPVPPGMLNKKGKPYTPPNWFGCPDCSSTQTLKPYEPKSLKSPNYFRFAITRTEEELEVALLRAGYVAKQMREVREGRLRPSLLANTPECAKSFGYGNGTCEFFRNHTYGVSTLEDPEFERTRDYVGEGVLIQIGEGEGQ
jgi:hypothetical protein